MKRGFLIVLWVAIALVTEGQPVKTGIGTNNPQAKLDIIKSFRVGGITPNSSYLLYDSVTGDFKWNNATLFVPSTQQLIKHSATRLQGLYYDNQRLEYRDDLGFPKFYTHWPTGNAYVDEFLGIGRPDPQVPLHFASSPGEKIIFWTNNPTINYGIGYQPGVLQIHTDVSDASVVFGYGSGEGFGETMRVRGDGRVGIGINNPQARMDVNRGSNYATACFYASNNNLDYTSFFNDGTDENTVLRGYKIFVNDIPGGRVGIGVDPTIADGVLDVGGRITIRQKASSTPAIWFSKLNNTTSIMAGMENNDYIGFRNSSHTYFGMNTQTGALKVNDSTGVLGQVLQSRGNTLAPSWVTPTKWLHDATTALKLSSTLNLTAYASPVDIPGLSTTVSVASNAYLLVRYQLETNQSPCDFCSGVIVYIDIMFDNLSFVRNIHEAFNVFGPGYSVTGTVLIPATAGNHPVKLMASCVNHNTKLSRYLANDTPNFIVQVINQ